MASLAVFTTLHSSRVLGRRDREESRMWDLAANEVGRTAYECKQRAQLLAPVQPEGYMGEYWRHATSRNDTGSIETEASTKRVSNAAIQDALKRLLGPYMKPGLTLAANKRWAREGLTTFSADDDGRTIRYIYPPIYEFISPQPYFLSSYLTPNFHPNPRPPSALLFYLQDSYGSTQLQRWRALAAIHLNVSHQLITARFRAFGPRCKQCLVFGHTRGRCPRATASSVHRIFKKQKLNFSVDANSFTSISTDDSVESLLSLNSSSTSTSASTSTARTPSSTRYGLRSGRSSAPSRGLEVSVNVSTVSSCDSPGKLDAARSLLDLVTVGAAV